MRKCGQCRSLLLGDVETCPRCGAPVPVAVGVAPAVTSAGSPPAPSVAAPAPSWPSAPPAPTAAAPSWAPAPAAPPPSWPPAPAPAAPAPAWGAPVAPAPSWPPAPPAGPAASAAPASETSRAPSYGRLSIPPPVPPTPVGAAYAPAAPAAQAPVSDAWQPFVIAAPAKPAIHHKPWARVALAVVVALVVGAAVMHLRSDKMPAGTSAFVAGNGVTYSSPDGAFQVQLPEQPQVQRQTLNFNGVRAPLYIGVVQTNSYVIGVASIVSPTRFSRSRVNDALDAMATQGAKSAHGTGL